MKKTYVLGGVTLASLAVLTLGAGQAQAHRAMGDDSAFATRLAQRFNLQEGEVKTFLAQEHEQRHENMKQRMEERLSTLVNEGKLTEEQKQAILAKHIELEALKETLKEKTPEERKAAMSEKRKEIEIWAQEQNIDLKLVFGGHFGNMTGRHGFRGMMP